MDTNITLGCDPELFLVDSTGKFISSIDRIGGTKSSPQDIGEGCAIQEDNVAVEFNTPPCKTVEDFIKAIDYNLEYLTMQARVQGLSLSAVPSAIFEDDQLQDMRAREFGCEPDFNAWNDGQQNPKPRAENPNLRSAGGHIHVGGVEDLDLLEVVKAMDLFVGVPMVLFDTDTLRRQLYGKAGAFRKKSYGVEYRTASNAWTQTKERISWVFDQTHKAVAFVKSGGKIDKELGEKIQKCINTSDVTLAKELTAQYE